MTSRSVHLYASKSRRLRDFWPPQKQARKMIHRHVWKIVSQVEQPSSMERVRDAGGNFRFKDAWASEVEAATRRTIVVTARCERCGTEKVYRA